MKGILCFGFHVCHAWIWLSGRWEILFYLFIYLFLLYVPSTQRTKPIKLFFQDSRIVGARVLKMKKNMSSIKSIFSCWWLSLFCSEELHNRDHEEAAISRPVSWPTVLEPLCLCWWWVHLLKNLVGYSGWVGSWLMNFVNVCNFCIRCRIYYHPYRTYEL